MRCLDAFVSRSILASSVIALAFASPGRAQFTWTNAAGGNWSVGANWGGTGPTAGGRATTTLTWGPSATYTSTDDFGAPTGFALNQMTFNHASGTVTIAASAGGTLDFSGTTPVLNVNGAGNAIINMPVNNLSAGATLVNLSVGLNVNSTGNLTVSGPL